MGVSDESDLRLHGPAKVGSNDMRWTTVQKTIPLK